MKKVPHLNPRVLSGLVTLVIAITAPASLSAQRPTPTPPNPGSPSNRPPPPPRGPEARRAEEALFDLEMLIMRKSAEAEIVRERREKAARLTEDFERLERLNAERIAPLSSTTSIDYKELSTATAEIKDRAVRIKYSIALPLKGKKSEKIRYEPDADRLSFLLPELSRVITSFLGNPVFRLSSPNDEELRSAARQDLESIIKLSETINKIAKRLSKASR
ncbi:MAG: hypothetical protein WAV20_05230 [Blastocatellia bacterium]